MFKNYYRITVTGKDVKRFLKSLYKMGISFISIIITDKEFSAKVDEENYNKIKNIKTSYQIKITKEYGFIYLKKLLKKNIVFLSSFLFGIILLFFLSRIIFKVEIVHDDKKMVKLISDELNNYNIKKYSKIKSYDEIQEIKDQIINNNKDKIEWMEIERIGSKYIVKFEKRIKNNIEEEKKIRHVVAKKNGIIKKIVASDGEIVKKINDYVKKGDIIISGEIHKGEDIKGNVSANGDIYAEVWYKVKVNLPINYYEEKVTKNNKNVLNISFLKDNYNLFDNNKYINKEIKKYNLYNDLFGLFEINFNHEKEKIIIDEVNLIINENNAINIAKDKIQSTLDVNEYIISQKKLKTILNNSTINVEIFFKVYENISSYNYYEINKGMN